MKIYHTETQEDYDALMRELEKQGYKPLRSTVFSLYGVNCCVNTEKGKYLSHCNKKYYEHFYPHIPIQKYKANSVESAIKEVSQKQR